MVIDSNQNEIDPIHEHCIRFIADAVTGKVDVREAAANLPEKIEKSVEELPDEELPELVDDDLYGDLEKYEKTETAP